MCSYLIYAKFALHAKKKKRLERSCSKGISFAYLHMSTLVTTIDILLINETVYCILGLNCNTRAIICSKPIANYYCSNRRNVYIKWKTLARIYKITRGTSLKIEMIEKHSKMLSCCERPWLLTINVTKSQNGLE